MIQNIYTNFDTEYKKQTKNKKQKTKTKNKNKKTKNKYLLCSISFRYQDLC